MEHHEVIVIGAGLTGIYQLYRLLEAGTDAVALEAADDLGGTWYRNRYPGCRFDSESYTYGYSFSKELLDDWDWSEHFAAQPETLRYLNHVADRFGLREQHALRLSGRLGDLRRRHPHLDAPASRRPIAQLSLPDDGNWCPFDPHDAHVFRASSVSLAPRSTPTTGPRSR